MLYLQKTYKQIVSKINETPETREEAYSDLADLIDEENRTINGTFLMSKIDDLSSELEKFYEGQEGVDDSEKKKGVAPYVGDVMNVYESPLIDSETEPLYEIQSFAFEIKGYFKTNNDLWILGEGIAVNYSAPIRFLLLAFSKEFDLEVI